MSKLSFRARALDATKPLPVYTADEIPEQLDVAAINRAVPQMPTGMDKEEELETHIQRALSAQQVFGTSEALVIPTPELTDCQSAYSKLYKPEKDYAAPKQYIHVQPFGMEHEIPDYDMDSEDESWLGKQSRKLEVTPLKFETMMDRLEKGSGQTVMTLQEAKALLKEDDDLIIAVYDYWLNKRLRLQHGLIPQVKTEKRDGTNSSNPYVAFRRRTEKMQTRKNRKNDEVSYEKMLKLRRDLSKSLTLMELIKRREKSKKEMLQLTIEIMDKRYSMQDFDGKAYEEANAKRHILPPTFLQTFTEYLNTRKFSHTQDDQNFAANKPRRRKYVKRKDRLSTSISQTSQPVVHLPHYNEVDVMQGDFSSEEEELSQVASSSEHETDADDPDGSFAFKRKPGVCYQAPINNGMGNWPWHGPDEGGMGDSKYRYSLVYLSSPKTMLGYARRRQGRGGRVIFDRGLSAWDEGLESIDVSSPPSSPCPSSPGDEYLRHIKEHEIPFFCPRDAPIKQYRSRAEGAYEPMDVSHSVQLEALHSDDEDFFPGHYQTHCEQLLQLQRQQQEHLLLVESSTEVSSASGTSRQSIDSSMAELAVSAVWKGNIVTGPVAKATPAFYAVQDGQTFYTVQDGAGPSVQGATTTILPVRNGPVSGSSVVSTASIVFTNSGPDKVIKVSSLSRPDGARRPQQPQLHFSAVTEKETLPKENHEGNNHIIREKNIMEVT